MAKKSNTTIVETNTSTSIGEIGLTGGDAVSMAATLGTTAIELERLRTSQVESLNQSMREGWNQLVGGAGALVQAGETQVLSTERTAGRAMETGQFTVQSIIDATKSFANNAISSARSLMGEAQASAETLTSTAVRGASVRPVEEPGTNMYMYGAIAIVAIAVFGLFRK